MSLFKRARTDHNTAAERALSTIESGLHDLYCAADTAWEKHERHNRFVEMHRAQAASALDDHVQHVDVADKIMDALPQP